MDVYLFLDESEQMIFTQKTRKLFKLFVILLNKCAVCNGSCFTEV